MGNDFQKALDVVAAGVVEPTVRIAWINNKERKYEDPTLFIKGLLKHPDSIYIERVDIDADLRSFDLIIQPLQIVGSRYNFEELKKQLPPRLSLTRSQYYIAALVRPNPSDTDIAWKHVGSELQQAFGISDAGYLQLETNSDGNWRECSHNDMEFYNLAEYAEQLLETKQQAEQVTQ